jgi:DNA invertase Pin-like site-specific DNA recombinase
MPVRTVIYARFSSDNQNPRSTADQIALCRQRADAEGWSVVASFEDAAVSGAAGIGADQRPGLAALLRLVEAGGIDQVLAESTDRLSRHVADAHLLRERIEFAGARLFTLFDGAVTPMVGLVKGFMDAQFRTDLAARVRRGQLGTLRDGRLPGSLAYGYRQANRIDARGNPVRGLREIDPERAEIVRRIFADYRAGQSPHAIVRSLNAAGIPGPRGGIWHSTALIGSVKHGRGMLRNPLYIGIAEYGRSRTVVDPRSRRRLMRANDPATVEQQSIPALRIIDDETWQAVQRQLAQNGAGRPERARRPRHILSGLGVCGVCGAAWVKRCGNFWGCSRACYGAACANTRLINTARYERLVLADLRAGMLAPDVVAEYVREYHRDFARRAVDLDRDRARVDRALADARRRRERLVQAFAQGGSEFAEIREMLAAARDEADRLERERASLAALPSVLAIHPGAEAAYRRQVDDLETALATPEARIEAVPRLRAMIARIVVSPNPDRQRGVVLAVVRQMDEILALATTPQSAQSR